MKVMFINGSPRKNWNTDILMKNALEGAVSAEAEAEMVYLYDLKFRGCVSCMACKLKKEPRPNRCIQIDDLTTVLDKVHEADAVVLGSPIYFSEATGEMRSFWMQRHGRGSLRSLQAMQLTHPRNLRSYK